MEEPTMFSCTACGEEFATVQQLKLHRSENHPQIQAPDTPQLQLVERPQFEERGELF